MSDQFTIQKILNNNVVIATQSENQEVILIGKGIGFGQKQGNIIRDEEVDKLFLLIDHTEQERYKKMLAFVDESLISLVEEVILLIQEQLGVKLDERIHLALTDHIQFAVRRIKQGIDIANPFLVETELMFPQEFIIARKVVGYLNKHLEVHLPEAEVGFITLHIYSAHSNQSIAELNEHPQLIQELVLLIEKELHIHIDRKTVSYMRLVSFLCDMVGRFTSQERLPYSKNLTHLLKEEFQLCYNVTNLIIDLLNKRFSSSYSIGEMPEFVLYLNKLSSIHKNYT